eukprot:scaffold35413_cov69-Phaeocystis_antarctica.AAC.1
MARAAGVTRRRRAAAWATAGGGAGAARRRHIAAVRLCAACAGRCWAWRSLWRGGSTARRAVHAPPTPSAAAAALRR